MAKTFQPSEMKDAGGNEYKKTIFFANIEAEHAKSIIFAAEAKVAIKSNQYIWAAIAAYYSLFHLSISLIYMVPRYVEQGKLTELIEYWKDGAADPTWRIKHKDIPKFLANCESKGLTSELGQSWEKAKDLREFVNYRPRVEWQDGKPYFRTREFKREDVSDIVDSLESLLSKCLQWVSQQGEWPSIWASISPLYIEQFFSHADLLYKEWCTPEVLSMADRIRQGLSMSGSSSGE